MVGGYKVNLPKATSTNKKNNSNKTITPVAVDTSYGGNMNTLLATPTITAPSHLPIATPTVKPINTGSYFDSGVVGTVGGLSGGGSNRGTTGEGVIIGNPSVNNSTFNNIDTSYGGNAVYTGAEPIKNITPKTPVATTYAANLGNTQESTPTAETGVNAAAETPAETPAPTKTETVDTYEQFLINQGKGYQDRLDKTTAAIAENKQAAIDLANKQRAEAEQKAESERQRGVIDARSSYEQNKATYGANAEMLASMGLTGGGHSDYIDSQAYAMQRAETQAANAQAEAAKTAAKNTADKAILAAESDAASDTLAAELTYAESMAANDKELAKYKQQKADEATAKAEKEAEEKKSNYTALLGSAIKGEYNAEQLAALGAQYGLSAAQIEQVVKAADDYKKGKQKEAFDGYLKASDMDGFATIKKALDNDEITQEQYNTLVAQYQTNYYDSYASSIDSDFAAVNTSDIDTAYSRGWITAEHYNKLKAKYNNGVASAITAASIFYSNGSALDKSTAQAVMDDLKATGWLTSDNTSKMQTAFDNAYNKSDDGGSCVAKGTQILLPNGQTAPIESLSVGDSVMAFDHTNGTCVETKIAYSYYANATVKIIKLNFTDGVSIELLNTGHGLFDLTLDKYVLITPDNANQYVGHTFAYLTVAEGQIVPSKVVLESCLITESLVERYDIVTENKLNHIANGLLACSDVLVGISNMFEFDNLLCDKAKAEEDIAKYGLYSYDEWAEHVSKEDFDTFNGAYFKIAVEKGLLTIEELFLLIGFIKTQWENMSISK